MDWHINVSHHASITKKIRAIHNATQRVDPGLCGLTIGGVK